MKITIDRDRCVGAGVCARLAAGVFDQRDEDGTVDLLDPEPPAELADSVREAALSCPSATISIVDRPPCE
jgi:ferredoxin